MLVSKYVFPRNKFIWLNIFFRNNGEAKDPAGIGVIITSKLKAAASSVSLYLEVNEWKWNEINLKEKKSTRGSFRARPELWVGNESLKLNTISVIRERWSWRGSCSNLNLRGEEEAFLLKTEIIPRALRELGKMVLLFFFISTAPMEICCEAYGVSVHGTTYLITGRFSQ